MELNDIILLNINKFIRENNLTWGGLAGKIGIHKQNIYHYRDKKYKFPLEFLDLVSKRFDVPISTWFHDGNEINILKEPEAVYRKRTDEYIEELKKDKEFYKELLSKRSDQSKEAI